MLIEGYANRENKQFRIQGPFGALPGPSTDGLKQGA